MCLKERSGAGETVKQGGRGSFGWIEGVQVARSCISWPGRRSRAERARTRPGRRRRRSRGQKGANVRHTRVTLAGLVLLALTGHADAQGIRTVTDEGEPIAVVTQVRHTTTVVVPASETIVDVVAGDGEYWDVSASGYVVYIKPLEATAASNVTLVAASGRVWALLVSESSADDPDLVVYIDPPVVGAGTLGRAMPLAFTAAAELTAEREAHAEARLALAGVEQAAVADVAAVRAEHAARAAAWLGEYPGRIEFPYRLEARARAEPFLVEGLWHDGRLTYLRSRAQETPALYEYTTDGAQALVAYQLHDDGLYVADHVLGPGRLVIGELWTEWGDVRPRPQQPISKRKAYSMTAALVGGITFGSWFLTR